ncbi:hypothetical protein K7432_007491 [Basidiobolus ranarum]|uniref:Uncharacterized protein n=1 Tax=Basidiobolus ranarum TaxID=34480 RepID=A0ABR2W0F9_9FUNG
MKLQHFLLATLGFVLSEGLLGASKLIHGTPRQSYKGLELLEPKALNIEYKHKIPLVISSEVPLEEPPVCSATQHASTIEIKQVKLNKAQGNIYNFTIISVGELPRSASVSLECEAITKESEPSRVILKQVFVFKHFSDTKKGVNI